MRHQVTGIMQNRADIAHPSIVRGQKKFPTPRGMLKDVGPTQQGDDGERTIGGHCRPVLFQHDMHDLQIVFAVGSQINFLCQSTTLRVMALSAAYETKNATRYYPLPYLQARKIAAP